MNKTNGSATTPERERSRGRELVSLADDLRDSRKSSLKALAGKARKEGAQILRRHGVDPAGSYTLGHFLQDVRGAAERPDARPFFPGELRAGPAGLDDSVTTHSGFLAPHPLSERVWTRVYETGEILNRCAEMPASPVSPSIVRVATVDEESRASGQRFGGLEFYWLTDGDEIPASFPKFGAADMPFRKCAALVYATEELIAGSDLLDQTMMELVPKAFAFKFEDAIVNGIGGGISIGILNSNAKITVSKEAGQGAGTIVWANIKKMWSRMWTASKRGNLSAKSTVWLVDNTVDTALYSLAETVGTGGVPVFQPANAAADHPYPTLFGRPIIPVEYCQTLGTEGDIILADLSQYLIVQKALRSALSFAVSWVKHEGCFRFVFGVDGQPGWHKPVTPANGGATQSPFITLQTRS